MLVVEVNDVIVLMANLFMLCGYRVMDARGKFGEHERCVEVRRVQL